jgi:hypothetical protein
MIKLLAIGLWACLVTVGATFGVIEWQKRQSSASSTAEPEKKIEEVKTKAINVPIIDNGVVQGYIIAQFVFSVDGNELKKLPINPETYLLDEAFKTIYAGEKVNFKQMKKQDLPSLAKMLGENVNKRLGLPIVQDVLIDQLAYIPQKDVRGPPKL